MLTRIAMAVEPGPMRCTDGRRSCDGTTGRNRIHTSDRVQRTPGIRSSQEGPPGLYFYALELLLILGELSKSSFFSHDGGRDEVGQSFGTSLTN